MTEKRQHILSIAVDKAEEERIITMAKSARISRSDLLKFLIRRGEETLETTDPLSLRRLILDIPIAS